MTRKNKIFSQKFQKICQFKATIMYIIFIIVINTSYIYFPFVTIANAPFSSGDVVVGIVYIFRDFAQREIKHYVILAMLFGAGISYFLADKTMAIASLCAFATAETLDWAIFTFTQKPLSQRLVLSSVISVPVDTLVFLGIYGPLNLAGFLVLCASKILGIIFVWYLWRRHKVPALNTSS